MSESPVRSMEVYRLRLPMRSFEHAAAGRNETDGVVVRVALEDGTEGWGETHPRAYVTGETVESVAGDLADAIWPVMPGRSADVELLDALPVERDGRPCRAARCAAEVALQDLRLRQQRGAWRPGRIAARVSGVLGSRDPGKTARRLGLMRWFGLRDFKLKLALGEEIDKANLAICRKRLGRRLADGRVTLRVDANGGWSRDETPDRVAALKAEGVCAVEQPCFCPAGELADLAARCSLPLIADESLITDDDAETLLTRAKPGSVWWNVRIAKQGGMDAAHRLALRALAGGAGLTLGCMVGETGLLSSAQRRLLETIPSPRFVEGNYGRFLLGEDLTRPSPRFGYGGRLRRLGGPGLGVDVDRGVLARQADLLRTLR
jgi:muconate cycloisomerase